MFPYFARMKSIYCFLNAPQELLLWFPHVFLPDVACKRLDLFLQPLKWHSFHALELNVYWKSGTSSTLLCCCQFFAFSFYYVEGAWRNQLIIHTAVALACLLLSEIFEIALFLFIGRRLKRIPEACNLGMTKPMDKQQLCILCYSGIFQAGWTTWPVWSILFCMSKVSNGKLHFIK